jgi:hypothetical protein
VEPYSPYGHRPVTGGYENPLSLRDQLKHQQDKVKQDNHGDSYKAPVRVRSLSYDASNRQLPLS